MEPTVAILRQTVPADLPKNKHALETLSKSTLQQSPLQFIPFQALKNTDSGKASDANDDERPFLLTHHNEVDDDIYYSPNTNRSFMVRKTKTGDYETERITKAVALSNTDVRAKELRSLELAANDVWDAYVKLYYGNEGVGSVFLKAKGDPSAKVTNFEGLFGVHKVAPDTGDWHSVHLVRVDEPKNGKCAYRIDSAVVMSIRPYKGTCISSSLQKDTAKTLPVRPSNIAGSHWENIGKIIEDVEIDFRSRLERVDIPKTFEIMDAAYKTNRDSVTGAMITGTDQSEEPMRTTGMGVGSAMIGQIADKAKQKQAEGNAFLDRMKAQEKAKEEDLKGVSETSHDAYTDMRANLKKKDSMPPPSPKLSPPPKSPFALGKAALKKRDIQANIPAPPASPAPEFVDFRSKLKKAGAK